jgi:hypothetical protein
MDNKDIKVGTIFIRKAGYDPYENDIFSAKIIKNEYDHVEIEVLKILDKRNSLSQIEDSYRQLSQKELCTRIYTVEKRPKITLKDMLGEE